MGKPTKRVREEDTYAADDFVENDDGNAAPKTKKTKKGAASATKGKDANENRSWELSSGRQPRRVEVSEFKGAKLINIREFYEKDGEYLPGKKGISLNIDQYVALLSAIPEINAHLKELGVDVKASAVEDDEEDEEEAEEKALPAKRTRVKPKKEEKANIEATSDEEEDD